MYTRISEYLLFILAKEKLSASMGGLLFLPYQSLYQITSPYGYHESSVRHAVNDLEREKLLEKLSREDGLYLTITKKGLHRVQDRYKRILIEPVLVDGQSWWQVIFDVPESKREIRDQLRNYLIGLGFKLWQDSVYLFPAESAYDSILKKTLQQSPWPGYFYLLKISEIAFGINGRLISQHLWNSGVELADQNRLIEEADESIEILKKKALNTNQRNAAIKKAQLTAKEIFRYFEKLPEFPVYFSAQTTPEKLGKKFFTLINVLSSTVDNG
ncbi:hypothetical protein HGA91_02540 [candidate division WWE3 bacterium]|nr:hypothetical protein [candidate division WWE3 bacterium]